MTYIPGENIVAIDLKYETYTEIKMDINGRTFRKYYVYSNTTSFGRVGESNKRS